MRAWPFPRSHHTHPSVAHRCRRNSRTCRFGSEKTCSGTNFSWLRSPNRPSPSSQAATGFRLPWVSRYGAGSRSVVQRAAG